MRMVRKAWCPSRHQRREEQRPVDADPQADLQLRGLREEEAPWNLVE